MKAMKVGESVDEKDESRWRRWIWWDSHKRERRKLWV